MPQEATPTRLAPSPPKIRGIKNVHAKQHTQSMERDAPNPLERIKACKTLADFRSVAANLDARICPKVVFSESAFQQLLVSGCSLRILLEFLSDPFLNVPNTQNMQRLWRWYVKELRSEIDSTLLHGWLRKQIFLGKLSKGALQGLIDGAFNPSGNISSSQQDMELCKTILDGLSSSAVFRISDLDADILNQLLMITSCEFRWQTPEFELLSFKILEACKVEQLKQMGRGISSLLASYLLCTGLDREFHILEGQVIKTLNFLLASSGIEISRAIAFATRALLRRIESATSTRPLWVDNLSRWCGLLLRHEVFKNIKHRSEWSRIERSLARHDIHVLCSYMKHLSHDEKCGFLLRHWFESGGEDGSVLLGNPSYSMELFDDGVISSRDTTAPFISMFEYLGPRASSGENTLPRLFSLLNKLEMHETSLDLFNYFKHSKTSFDVDTLAQKIINHTSPDPRVACAIFKTTPSLPLEVCPSIAELMINDPTVHPRIPFGFRDRCQVSIQVSNVHPCTLQEMHLARMELLNRMAVAYAHAPHIYPRVAFRQVYQCYLLHRMLGRGSTSVDISKALMVAGVIRPLQDSQWVSTVKLSWILKIVSEVEGDEVASKIDELVYVWRGEIHRKQARMNLEMQLKREIGFLPPEVEEVITPIERKSNITRFIAGEQLGKMLGERNADEFLRVRRALDIAFAKAYQNAAMGERGFREGL